MIRQGNIFAPGGSTSDDDLIEWIIREEGFNKVPEDIGDGKMTLGSGLTDPKWHALYKKRGNKWSAADNRKAVAEEVASRRRWAEKNIPNWGNLPDSAQKALISYKYNYDFNAKNSPKLFDALSRGDYREAARQIDATSKNPDFKNGLMKRRRREQAWFLSDFDLPSDTHTLDAEVPYTPMSMLPFSTAVNNPYILPVPEPMMVPREDEYVAVDYDAEQRVRENALRALENQRIVNAIQMMGDWGQKPAPKTEVFQPSSKYNFVVNRNADGGQLNQWDNLSLAEKAEMMKVAIKNGITDLPTIRQKYNEFAEGGDVNNSWTMEDEAGYRAWRESLPDNLRYTKDSKYDMRAAYKSGAQPQLYDDGRYHLPSRDPKTGMSLKSPVHPTHTLATFADGLMGYHPYMKNGREYTDTWEGNERMLQLTSPEKPPIPFTFAEGGSIHIDPSKKGTFTAAASKHGMGVQEFASKVLAHPENYSPAMRKKANFARNSKHWKHDFGGNLFEHGGGFWDTVDAYANGTEKALSLGSLAATGATLAAPNPYTLGAAYATNIGSALVDGYQGIRAALKGDYGNAAKNAVELVLSISGAKLLSDAKKLTDLDDALRAANATREYVTKTVGRRAATRHTYKVTKEATKAVDKSATGYALSLGANASSMGDLPTKAFGGNLFDGLTQSTQFMEEDRFATTNLPEVTVTAPRKYVAGYDDNGNPIYTDNPQESMGYTPYTGERTKYQEWANRDKNAPKYSDAFVKAAQGLIGAPLATIAGAPVVEASMPVMEAMARPLTTTTRVGSRLFPSLSKALPYTEMADRGLMGYMGAKGAYDAGKGWYNGEMPWYQAVPQMGLSALMVADAAPVVAKGLNKASTFMASPYTGKWTTVGNRQYRLSPNSLGANGVPIESRKTGDYSVDIGVNKLRGIFEDYEKGLTRYKGAKLPDPLEYKFDTPEINIDFSNLTTDNFVDYLSKQTGRTLKRVPIKDTAHGDIYNEGFAFIDENGKEVAHIAGRRKGGRNVWVESSYVDPEFRYKGLGKQMYFDLNDHVFSTYGTTLHSDPMQRVGSTGVGMSPSNRLWKNLRDNGMSTVEGEGFHRYDIMAEPSQITTAYRASTTPTITAENATSITPEQWTAAQDAVIARGDMAEAQRLRDLHSSLTDSATPGKYYRGTQTKRNSYPDRHIDEEVGEMNGIYLTKKPKYAKTYGDVEEFYLRSNNPLKTEGSWTGVIDDATRAEIENAGYDAVVNNRFDTGFLNKLLRNSRDETITFNGKNLKLADAVTYDDKGVRIPLGERDNFNINDIRWGLLPFAGITGAAASRR